MKRTILLFAGLALLTMKTQAQTVTDYDGNVYNTVTIGTQTWIKENLKVTHYRNGTYIPNIADNATWANLSSGARCYYNNDSTAYDSVYGPLYNWYAVSNTDSLCPPGWHVPTDNEWTVTENFLGGSTVAGGKMKEAGYSHWLSPNYGANNSSGFTGLPGGMRTPDNIFNTIYENGLWWASTAMNASFAWSRYLYYMDTGVDRNPAPINIGLSIRCIKDITTGIKEINDHIKIKLFPNPAANFLTISCAEVTIFEMTVINLVGELIMKKELQGGTNQIDISSLATGMYIIKVIGDGWTAQKKLIKE